MTAHFRQGTITVRSPQGPLAEGRHSDKQGKVLGLMPCRPWRRRKACGRGSLTGPSASPRAYLAQGQRLAQL
eukprot:9134778-Alexandrium_andersonii.AAC.2